MYKFSEIEILHVELTSNCQASCPMCARNHKGGGENPLLRVSDIDLDSFKVLVNLEFIKQLKAIVLCGNFGDPIVNNDLIKIVEYISSTNPNIKLDIHTNGSARSTKWWTALAIAMPVDHVIHFGIDGLEDTHSLYRIGTSFNKIIENATAFIKAGGRARWNFITFKHNEHQLDAARQLAKDLGFESFHEKQTSRFIGDPWFDIYDKDGNVTHRLESPKESKVVFIERDAVKNYRTLIDAAVIDCEVERTKSIYIDALGYVWPCCFVGANPYLYAKQDELVYEFTNNSRNTLERFIDKFGGMEGLNLRKRSMQEIVDSAAWQTQWDESFKKDKLEICARTCGKFSEPIVGQCRDQFLELSNFQ
jgi:MoaA/NifB/PqqE/SkfB family radical SAM enzyme